MKKKAVIFLIIHVILMLIAGFVFPAWAIPFMVCAQASAIFLYAAIRELLDGQHKVLIDGLIFATVLEIPDCLFGKNEMEPIKDFIDWIYKFGYDVCNVVGCALLTRYRWIRYKRK